VSPVAITALFLSLWEIIGRKLPSLPQGPWPRIPRLAVAVGSLLLVAGFGAQLLLLAYQAGHDGVRPDWVSRTPFLYVDEAFPFGPDHGLISLAALAAVLAQMAGFLALVGAVAQPADTPADAAAGRFSSALAPLVAGVLAVLALWSPAVSSGDVFGYAGLGMLGPHPFERPPHFFTGEYAAVFDSWHLRPTIYGPLWTTLNAAVVSFGTTFAGKVLALRVFGLVLLLAFTGLVHVLVRSRAVTLAVLLNPMLWLQFVTNAHNDILGACLLAAAQIFIVRKRPALAVFCVAGAGLVKFPFVVMGAVAFARQGPRRAFGYAAAAAVVCFVLSAIFAGRPYLDALLLTARTRAAFTDPVLNEIKLVLSLATLAVTAIILLRGKYPAFAGWLYTGLAPVMFPWYLLWAVSYSLFSRTLLLATLLSLPLVALLSDDVYAFDMLAFVLPAAAGLWLLWSTRATPGRLRPASR